MRDERRSEVAGFTRRPLLRTLVGRALRRQRQAQRRTLGDVARAARVSLPYLSEVERGRKEASSEVLAAVCDALHIELAELLEQVGRDLAEYRAPVIRLDLATRANTARASATRASTARPTAIRPPIAGRSGPSPAGRAGDVVLLAA